MEVPCRTYLGKTGLTFLLLSTFLFAHIENNFFASAHLTRFPFVRKCSPSLGGRATDFSLLSRAERCGGGKEKVKVEKTRRAGLALSLSKPVFTLGSPPPSCPPIRLYLFLSTSPLFSSPRCPCQVQRRRDESFGERDAFNYPDGLFPASAVGEQRILSCS